MSSWHTAETWAPGGPGCRGSGSARPEAARPGVALACLLPCRLYRPPPCPAWGMLCHHHLASGTSHPQTSLITLSVLSLVIWDQRGHLSPGAPPTQSRDPPDPSLPLPGVTSAGRLGVAPPPPAVGGSAPPAPPPWNLTTSRRGCHLALPAGRWHKARWQCGPEPSAAV